MVAGFVAFGNWMRSTPERRQLDIGGKTKAAGTENCKELSPRDRGGDENNGASAVKWQTAGVSDAISGKSADQAWLRAQLGECHRE
jgi:hypothetical protein